MRPIPISIGAGQHHRLFAGALVVGEVRIVGTTLGAGDVFNGTLVIMDRVTHCGGSAGDSLTLRSCCSLGDVCGSCVYCVCVL